MKHFNAIITEDCSTKGQKIANTKSPGQYQGMNLKQFTEAVKYI